MRVAREEIEMGYRQKQRHDLIQPNGKAGRVEVLALYASQPEKPMR
jgi:hypothetical protein